MILDEPELWPADPMTANLSRDLRDQKIREVQMRKKRESFEITIETHRRLSIRRMGKASDGAPRSRSASEPSGEESVAEGPAFEDGNVYGGVERAYFVLTEARLINLDAEPASDDENHSFSLHNGGRQKGWELNEAAFSALLSWLDADRERAGELYGKAHRRLTKFFECRGCAMPSDLADEVINRVARRIEGGVKVEAHDPMRYFYGVARKVLFEYQKSRERQFIPLPELKPAAHPVTNPFGGSANEQLRIERERQFDCLARCLQETPAEIRDALLEYYRGESHERIERRKRMAEDMGISVNALKIRIHRLRAKLVSRAKELLSQFQ